MLYQHVKLNQTTGVGENVAIPHAKSADFDKAMIVYAKSNEGVEWEV